MRLHQLRDARGTEPQLLTQHLSLVVVQIPGFTLPQQRQPAALDRRCRQRCQQRVQIRCTADRFIERLDPGQNRVIEQAVLVSIMAIERGRRDVHTSGDIRNRNVVIPVLPEQLACCCQYLLLTVAGSTDGSHRFPFTWHAAILSSIRSLRQIHKASVLA